MTTGRDLAAWLGLTPLNTSSGGKERLGRITKKGDHYIRKLLIVGMTSRALMAKLHPEKVDIWTARMLAGKAYSLTGRNLALWGLRFLGLVEGDWRFWIGALLPPLAAEARVQACAKNQLSR